jgi:hypothetical protein
VRIGSHRSFQFVLEYVAAFHDKLHSLKLSQVDWAGASEQTRSSKPAQCISSAWRDVNRGCSTLRPHEGWMKRYSGSDKTGLFDF